MPYSDELNREYTTEEERFWKEAKYQAKQSPGTLRIMPVARGLGVSEQRARQFARTWDNDDLVRVIDPGANKITLTPFGRQFEFGDTSPF